MAGQAKSWKQMTVSARLFISTVVLAGVCVLGYAVLHPSSSQPLRFVCYLLVALIASRLKVNLPGITGTISVNFLFILLGILELSFAETLALGCAAILTQCFYRDRPRFVQVLFNTCATSFAISLAYCVYHVTLFRIQNNPAILLVATASTYFVANTIPVAGVMSLTEHKC